ncbi:unnamed protein product [Brugia pahangi]|uniref:Uncharacterized protein n=1 Tax=Brugia pahangi TaxID=6280 RepID=A0A3P7SHF4_BRUPA|nr:unnamed protein product [Brugia pahangi]
MIIYAHFTHQNRLGRLFRLTIRDRAANTRRYRGATSHSCLQGHLHLHNSLSILSPFPLLPTFKDYFLQNIIYHMRSLLTNHHHNYLSLPLLHVITYTYTHTQTYTYIHAHTQREREREREREISVGNFKVISRNDEIIDMAKG